MVCGTHLLVPVLLISHAFENCVGRCTCVSAGFVLKSMRVKGRTQNAMFKRKCASEISSIMHTSSVPCTSVFTVYVLTRFLVRCKDRFQFVYHGTSPLLSTSPLLTPSNVRATRARFSKTSVTPSFVFAEHSK